MTTTAYITTKLAPAVARTMKALGYRATIQQIKARYVMNVVTEFAGGCVPAQRELENAITDVISLELNLEY